MKTVILAGGMGTRLGEITESIPKPMVHIGGKPILWHIMKFYSSFGYTDFVILGGYRSEVIKKYFADFHLINSDVKFSLSSDTRTYLNYSFEDWNVTVIDSGINVSTGSRILAAKEYLVDSEAFFLTYGDGLSDVKVDDMLDRFRISQSDAMLTAVRPPGRYGQINIMNDKVTSFNEKTPEPGFINGGFFIFRPSIFDYIPAKDCSLEIDVLDRIASDGKLNAYLHNGFWQSMDTPRDIVILEHLWDSGKAPWKTW